jgi:negative regulator of sigma E activity
MAQITTTKGLMDEELLEKKEGLIDDENERTSWVEYWLDGELVHRSVHVHLKKALVTGAEAASIV